MKKLLDAIKHGWQFIEEITGNNAYEKYTKHIKSYHPEQPILSKHKFAKLTQEQKFSGVKRCC